MCGMFSKHIRGKKVEEKIMNRGSGADTGMVVGRDLVCKLSGVVMRESGWGRWWITSHCVFPWVDQVNGES